MLVTLTLTKDDILTKMMGLHYEIITPMGIVINFSPDALEEFLNDIKSIKEWKKNQEESNED